MCSLGIVGLGLIGGSLAKSARKHGYDKIYGFDIDNSVVEYATLCGIIDAPLNNEKLSECDVVMISLYPDATVEYVSEHRNMFKKDALVIDCAGVKRSVCTPCFEISEKCGFHFVGGHPMAGTQYSGIKNSKDTMFHNACFVLVPRHMEDVNVISKARETVISLGFSRVSVMTPERHDELIAFTSQLAHVVSNAYVKSPSALSHKGISAGSYKDLTRVAYLNEDMWTQLFMDNRDNLMNEIKRIIDSLSEYYNALENSDSDALKNLLREGKEAKEACEK
ncbi:MAG: prephenate dehydrogenase [Eubacteriales bacterium]|nr:prephenate dehydrogenase [Eubacteriales bacterium]